MARPINGVNPAKIERIQANGLSKRQAQALLSIDLIKWMINHMTDGLRGKRATTQQLFYALAEPTRRDIIEMLASSGQLSASDISDNFAVSAPAISQHLKVLREANFVRVEKRAQQRIYHINTEAISEIEGWVQKISELWNDRFNALDKILETEKEKMVKRK